jgi:hypothetical protein
MSRPALASALALVVLAATACGGASRAGYSDPRVPGVTVAPWSKDEHPGDLRARELRVPMSQEAAVTENVDLVLEFMNRAGEEGAVFVSGVQIRLYSKEADGERDCVTWVYPVRREDGDQKIVWALDFRGPRCAKLQRKIDDPERPHELRGTIWLPR